MTLSEYTLTNLFFLAIAFWMMWGCSFFLVRAGLGEKKAKRYAKASKKAFGDAIRWIVVGVVTLVFQTIRWCLSLIGRLLASLGRWVTGP